MAYDKKYIGEKEVIKEYLDGREDRIEGEFKSTDNRAVAALEQLKGKVFDITVLGTAEQISPVKLMVHGNMVFLHGGVKATAAGNKLFSIPPEFAPSSPITFSSGTGVMTLNEFGDATQYNNTVTLHLGQMSWSIADK